MASNQITLVGYFVYGLILVLLSQITLKILNYFFDIDRLLFDFLVYFCIAVLLFWIARVVPFFKKHP